MENIDRFPPIEATLKMNNHGRSALSNAELIAVCGQIDENLARKILLDAENQISHVTRMGIDRWIMDYGLTMIQASALMAGLELGRRRNSEQPNKQVKIHSSVCIFQHMKPYLMDEVVEHFYIILLNRNNEIIKRIKISSGGTTGTIADPKLIFKHALDHLACAIVLVHNHPSGNLRPSDQDKRLTNKLKDAGKFLDIPILDHLIFTDIAYFSFADEGLL